MFNICSVAINILLKRWMSEENMYLTILLI